MSQEKSDVSDRRLPVGVEVLPDGRVHARVWATAASRVAVIFDDADGGAMIELIREPSDAGYFSGILDGARVGQCYRYRLDDSADLLADPVSRFQPDGISGSSQIVDPRAFRWTDDAWSGVTSRGQVLYELHVGTFTREGMWAAAIERLDDLAEIGITCIEMMPVNEFPGRWNWGYDGVFQFAPTRAYGKPDDLRRFVDAAHARGIGVILDVVYNHFGPAGCILDRFSPHYFTDKHRNDWGKSLNFDDIGSAQVREFFCANAKHWIEEYHFDGFRFDATQALLDDSPRHVLAEITDACRAAGGKRSVYLVNENEPQHTRLVRPHGQDDGIGMDALWNDDFHHSARVALTGRRDAYFTDYAGSAQELLSALKYGYLYQGQVYRWQSKRRGTPGLDLPPEAFVNYIQNHDQIANYAHGERLYRHTSPAQLRAITALMLFAPQTPMLFQGQEWNATAYFNFFNDMPTEALQKSFEYGRKREVGQFPTVGSPEMMAKIANPSDRATFERSKLDWSERNKDYHAEMLRLTRDALRLRRDDPLLNKPRAPGEMDGAILAANAFCLRYFGEYDDDRLLIINMAEDTYLDICPEPLMAPPRGKQWTTLFSSEDPKYGGNGFIPPETRGEPWRLKGENWRLISRCTTVLKAVPQNEVDAEEAEKARNLKIQRGET